MQKNKSVSFVLVFAAGVAACDSTNANNTPSDAATDTPVSEVGAGDTSSQPEASTDARAEASAADALADSPVDSTITEASVDAGVDGGDGGSDGATDAPVTPPGVVALPGYTVSVFATGGTMYSHPDSLELDGTHVWVGYNMGVKTKDGTDAGAPYSSM
ncbi:MAG: hypothetical protein M3O46_08930, partial [Myxococcota bacterium]|nr:hypothetical protein [Myxococcota bacterium]